MRCALSASAITLQAGTVRGAWAAIRPGSQRYHDAGRLIGEVSEHVDDELRRPHDVVEVIGTSGDCAAGEGSVPGHDPRGDRSGTARAVSSASDATPNVTAGTVPSSTTIPVGHIVIDTEREETRTSATLASRDRRSPRPLSRASPHDHARRRGGTLAPDAPRPRVSRHARTAHRRRHVRRCRRHA